MGRAIYYCVQCSKRVSDTDIETGKAFRVGERILCSPCAPASAKTQTSKKVPAVSRPRNSGTSVAMRSVTAPLATPPPRVSSPDRSKIYLLAGAGAAAAVLLIVILLLVFRKGGDGPESAGDPPPKVEASGKTAGAAPIPPAVGDPKVAAANAELGKAREFAKAHPEDLTGQLRLFTDLVWKWEGTEVAREATKDAAAVKAAIMAKVSAWMVELEREIQGLQPLVAARKITDELKSAHDLPEWKLAAEKRASELFADGKRIEEAEKAKKPEQPVPGGEGKPVPKSLSEEAKAYQAKWEGAVARATARDFAGAIAELEGSAASLKDAELKLEMEDDVALLKKAATVFKESMDTLKQKPKGAGLSVDYRDGAGAVKRAGGAVLQSDGERVELRGSKGSVFIEWADVTSATLAEIAQKGKFEPRTLTVLCLLEGETEAARAFQSELPAKWWTYAAGARSKIPKPEPSEKSARELFASAENAYRSMETRAAAVESYRALRADYTSTALVKAYSDRIFRRSEAGKEYYVAPADFRVEGTIRLTKNLKLESSKDSDDPETIRNFAELDFAALPGQVYRCWLWVGACCEETFLFYYQGTELTDLDSKKKKISCDPGSNFAVSVKHSIRNLKKTHDDHRPKGQKVHPKTPARWEWIEIVLPKYAGPGGKKLRFMTNQAGFSIAGAVVSATRKTPPPEPEIKELEKVRAQDDPPLAVDPDLVGWWTLDEAGGDVVDLSGKGHTGKLVGNVKSIDGKVGGALQATGGSSGMQAADAEDLRITGDLTMAIWVKKTAEAGDWVCVFGKGSSPQRTYGLWLEPSTKKYMYQQYGGSDVNVYGKKLVEVGQWTHLAVTIEQDLVRVYHNGVLDDEQRRPGRPPVNDGPLGLAFALAHEGLNGAIDDARLYRRALSADEIRSLFDMGK